MRRTGKLYTLTLVSSLLTIIASLLVTFWNEDSSAFHLWLDLIPQGFGMASFITSTLIVSHVSEKQIGRLLNHLTLGHDSWCLQRRHGRRYWECVPLIIIREIRYFANKPLQSHICSEQLVKCLV